jgi:iron complex outermembrane recepter protein
MSRKFMLLAGVSAALFTVPAFAQDAEPAEADTGLEEIIVTAQKREQNLQNVPVFSYRPVSRSSGEQPDR